MTLKILKKDRKSKEAAQLAVDTAHKTYVTIVRGMRSLTDKPEAKALVQKYTYLQEELGKSIENLKKAARTYYYEFDARESLLDEEDVQTRIAVTPVSDRITYNVDQARKLWPASVFFKVIQINSTAVRSYIDEGDLEEELAEQCATRKPDTPRVSITLLDAPTKTKRPPR